MIWLNFHHLHGSKSLYYFMNLAQKCCFSKPSTFDRLSTHVSRQSPTYLREKRRLTHLANQEPVFRSHDQSRPISLSQMVTVADGDIMEVGLSQTEPRTYQQLIKQIGTAQKKNSVDRGFWETFLQREVR